MVYIAGALMLVAKTVLLLVSLSSNWARHRGRTGWFGVEGLVRLLRFPWVPLQRPSDELRKSWLLPQGRCGSSVVRALLMLVVTFRLSVAWWLSVLGPRLIRTTAVLAGQNR